MWTVAHFNHSIEFIEMTCCGPILDIWHLFVVYCGGGLIMIFADLCALFDHDYTINCSNEKLPALYFLFAPLKSYCSIYFVHTDFTQFIESSLFNAFWPAFYIVDGHLYILFVVLYWNATFCHAFKHICMWVHIIALTFNHSVSMACSTEMGFQEALQARRSQKQGQLFKYDFVYETCCKLNYELHF